MAVKLDSSKSWVVAILTSLILSASIWAYRCSSVLFIGIYERFGTSRKDAAWPITAYFVSSCFMGPFVGTLSQRFQIRTLFLFSTCFSTFATILSSFASNIWELSLSMGLLLGCSAGIPVTLAGVLVTQYFNKYRTAAMGVFMAGPSLSSIVLPSVMQFCLEKYQLSGTLLLFAGLTMQGIPASLLLFTIDKPEAAPSPPKANVKLPLLENSQKRVDSNPTGNKIPIVVLRQLSGNRVRRDTPRLSIDDGVSATRRSISIQSIQSIIKKRASALQVFKKKWFYIIGVSHIAFVLNMSTLLNLMEDFGRDKNLEPAIARNLIGVFAGADLLARLGSAWITDGGYMESEHLFMLSFFLKAVCHVLLGLTTNPIVLLALVAVLGWLFGSTVILFTDIIRDRLSMQCLAFACGWYFFFGGLLGLCRPAAIGYFREYVGSYNPMMYLLSGILTSAVVVYLVGYLLERRVTDQNLKAIQEAQELEEELDCSRIRSGSFTPSLSSM